MIVVFTGPSLPAAALAAIPELRVLPPAAQGDVYRAARERPWGIGIIDGLFERVPAIWHKEILWAMSEGVHVFGAASMGALRAAELADFGMIGIGQIFEAYRDGTLTGDDEVALAHLPAEHGHRPVSEALVNIRATLAAAVDAGVCTPELAARLVELARRRFYPARSWSALFAEAGDDVAALEAWLPGGRVDQKRRDAEAMIAAMQAARSAQPGRLQPAFTFQHTDLWDRALHAMREQRIDAGGGPDAQALLDELRLVGDEQLYNLAVQGALLRGLAEHTAERHGLVVGTEMVQRTAMEFRRAHGLYTGPTTTAWLAEQGLDPESFFHMMTRQARLRWTAAVYEPELQRHLVDQLRAMSWLGRLEAQSRHKRAALEREGLSTADLADGGSSDQALWQWYFQDRLGVPVPDDLAGYAARFGFGDVPALFRAVVLERWYATRT